MAVTVELVRSVITHLYLTHAFGIVSFNTERNHPDNFHLFDNGPHRNLQVFSNSELKLQHIPTDGCQQNFTASAMGNEIYVTPQRSLGTMLYLKNNEDAPFYLRVNQVNDNSVELVCQQYVDDVMKSGNPRTRQELEFDLVTTDVDNIYDNTNLWSGSGQSQS